MKKIKGMFGGGAKKKKRSAEGKVMSDEGGGCGDDSVKLNGPASRMTNAASSVGGHKSTPKSVADQASAKPRQEGSLPKGDEARSKSVKMKKKKARGKSAGGESDDKKGVSGGDSEGVAGESARGSGSSGISSITDEPPQQTTTPRADVMLPERPLSDRSRRGGSRQAMRNNAGNSFPALPKLMNVSLKDRPDLFIRKMQMCEQGFCFTGDVPDSVSKDMHTKRQTLLELVDYVNQAQQVSEVFTDKIQKCVVRMVSANIFRSLPAMEQGYDAEQDEPTYEASWPHLQVVYEFLLRFVISSQVSSKNAKKHINHAFCSSLVELFDSEDPRERDYLKTILHRIYGKFMAHRAFIRRTIRDTFFSFVYETDRFNGIGELLEILGSIINGFALPLKTEHVHFLHKALIPLHKPKCIGLYHQQLVYCITQYMEKDKSMCEPIVRGLISYWPWTSTNKVVLFIHELEEILELAHPGVLETLGEECLQLIMQTVSRCISSPHFQIAERMLFLWNNQYLTSDDALFGTSYTKNVLPLVIGALVENVGNAGMPRDENSNLNEGAYRLALHLLLRTFLADWLLSLEILYYATTASLNVSLQALSNAFNPTLTKLSLSFNLFASCFKICDHENDRMLTLSFSQHSNTHALKLICSFTGHWNPTVKQLTDSVIKMYQKGDAKLFDSILAEYNIAKKQRELKRVKSERAWAALSAN